MDVCAVARRVLPARTASARRTGPCRRAIPQHRGQRHPLPPATAGGFRTLGLRDACGFRVRGEGTALHYPYEATAGRDGATGEFLCLGPAATRAEAGPVAVAVP